MKSSSSYFSFSFPLVFSLVMHLAVVAWLFWQAGGFSNDALEHNPLRADAERGSDSQELRDSKVIEVRSLSPEDLRKIVQTSEANTEDLVLESETSSTQFLSDRNQRVKEQTRATDFGSVSGGTRGSDTETEVERMERLNKIKGLWELPAPSDSVASYGNSQLDKGTMDLLDDSIAVSSRTLLNTDEYRYASFFNRVKEAVAPRWEPRVQVFLRKTLVLGQGIFSTKCAFWLNADGVVERVEVLESSGSKELDLIASQAIVEVGQFINPPDALKTKNGLHRVELGFLVDATKPRVQTDYLPDPRFMPDRRLSPQERTNR